MMKRKLEITKNQSAKRVNEKKFTTAEEVGSYFFPKGRSEKSGASGKERGAKAAENAFTEIAKSLES